VTGETRDFILLLRTSQSKEEGGSKMKLARRNFLQLAAGAAALPAVSRIARAQSYPTRPVRIMVGFAAGGATDIVARIMGQWLSERLGQQFVVENRPGAGTNIATEAVVNAAPDGHTLLMVSPTNAVNATLYDRLSYNFIRDIAPVAGVTRVANVMVVNPSFPAKTVPEFIAYAKANPGRINMASGGTGSSNQMSGELFKMLAGVDLVHVPYRGAGPALPDLISGQVQVMFVAITSSIEYIKAGRLRALGVTTTTRSEALPDVPTIADFVPGYEDSNWWGFGTPKATPAPIVDKLNQETNAALADSRIKARLAELGGMVLAGSPADFSKLIAAETEKWAKVIKFAGIKPD
jgi:tripartite-type tricarboxylate transporter receptor subunit TctC